MAEEIRSEDQNIHEALDSSAQRAAAPAAGVVAPGIDAFNEVTKDVTLSDTYLLEDVGDHKKHYEGVLGSFDYDDRQFELRQAVNPSQGDSDRGDFMFLAYIGKETEGKNILIPQGLENTAFMFAGTQIQSAPVIPDGVKRADCMFMDCHQLKEAKLDLPSSLESTAYMFANCEHLEKGPRVIPGTVKNADYMFGSCASLQHTPQIRPGVQSMDAAFMDCKTLTDAPKLPKTVRTAKDATLGCTGIDQAKDAAQSARQEREREAMIKKTERRTITQRLGSGFAAVLQFHAMHQRGYGLLTSMWQVHEMRKHNQLGRNVRDGLAAVAQRHGPLGLAMAMKMRASSQAKDQARQERHLEYIQEWTRLHSLGSEFNKGLKKMASTGTKDVKSGLFEQYATMTGSERDAATAAYGMTGVYKSQEDTVRSMNALAGGDTSLYKQVAQWYKERLADKEAYFSEAEHAIKNDKSLPKARRAQSLEGLELAKSDFMQPLVDSMRTMQEQYGLFNQGDQRDIDRVLKKMGQPSLFHTDDAEAQKQRIDQQTQNHQQPMFDWRAVPNRSAEPAPAPEVAGNDRTPTADAHKVSDAAPEPTNAVPAAEQRDVQPAVNSVKPASEMAQPAAAPTGGAIAKPEGGHSLTHEDRVRLADAVSADVPTSQPGKSKGDVELQ